MTGAGLGIEAAAMRGVLAARADGGTGRPVAVLPGGVDRPVPVAHADLIERIAAHGLVLSETTAIRALLDPVLLDGTVPNISLGSDLYLPRGYESGNVAAIPYDLSALPSEQQLRRDLQHFLLLYGESVAARSVAVASRPSEFNVSPLRQTTARRTGYFSPRIRRTTSHGYKPTSSVGRASTRNSSLISPSMLKERTGLRSLREYTPVISYSTRPLCTCWWKLRPSGRTPSSPFERP